MADENGATDAALGTIVEIEETVIPAFTTVHLPPDRAVITTPALIGLLERCVAAGEATRGDGSVRHRSVSVELRHRAGVRAGERLTLRAQREPCDGSNQRWRVVALAADGRTVAEGWVARAEEQ